MNKVIENYNEAYAKEAYIISAAFGPYEEEFLRASKLVLAE